MTAPLLTIAIPTYNRASYLDLNLKQLQKELKSVPAGAVEIIVSDNCSPDETPAVVKSAIDAGMPVRSIRNEKNLGWALNFIQCYEQARGKYVLLFGDDDLFVDGALPLLVDRLATHEFGVVVVRPYGFDFDFRAEHPGGKGRERYYADANQFLIGVSRYFTLTSACVINKSIIPDIDPKQFVTTDLAAFHFVLRAALAARENLFIDRYLIASKRQNSFSYDYAKVFVGALWSIIDAHKPYGLTENTIRKIERDKILRYYPFYMFDFRLARRGDPSKAYEQFAGRFGDQWLFRFWLAPILRWPRPLALAWGAATTFIGRAIDGELRRGFKFATSRIARMFGRSAHPHLKGSEVS